MVKGTNSLVRLLVLILFLLFIRWVIFNFFILKNGYNSHVYLIRLLGELNKKTHEQFFTWYLAFSSYSIHVNSEKEKNCK